MNIGEAIKELRKTKNVKQKDLAIGVGVSATHLSLVESGDQKPSVDLIDKIANYFGLPASAIVYLALKDNFENEEQQKYFDAAKPIIDKLMNYLLSDNSTTSKRPSKVTIKHKKRVKQSA